MVVVPSTASLRCWRLVFFAIGLLTCRQACAGESTSKKSIDLKDIKEQCQGSCGEAAASYNFTSEKCEDKKGTQTKELPNYTCDLVNRTDEYLLVIHKAWKTQMVYKTLHIQNADAVRLMATAISDTIEFTNVRSIATETQSSTDDLFRSLTLTNAAILDVTFEKLKILKLINSTANNVALPNLQEIDITEGSVVNQLNATILKPKSTFVDSKIGELSYLEVGNEAILNITNMEIKVIRSMALQNNSWFAMRSSQVDEIDQLNIRTGNAMMDNVTIGEIKDTSLQISGGLVASNSEFIKAGKNGIIIRQNGLVNFDNVSVNSQFVSYKLQGIDKGPNSTLSIQMLYSTPTSLDAYFWITVLILPFTVLIMGAVIIFLVLKRNSARSFSAKLKSSFNSKSFTDRSEANIYMPPATKEEISMPEKAGKDKMDQKESIKVKSSPAPVFSSKNSSAENDSTPLFPPPPAHQGSVLDDQDLYVDAGSEPPPPPPGPENNISPQQSSLHHPSKNLFSDAKPGAPYLMQKPTLPLKPAAPNSVPSLPLKPVALNPVPFPNPLKPTNHRPNEAHPQPPPVDSLPPSSHYTLQSKPKPPPRRGSEITTSPLPTVAFNHPEEGKDDLGPYEDIAEVEPIYASEDELQNY